MLDGDVAEYYSWFVSKRYNLILNKPLRGAHVSFINDSLRDMMLGNSCDEQEAEKIIAPVGHHTPSGVLNCSSAFE